MPENCAIPDPYKPECMIFPKFKVTVEVENSPFFLELKSDRLKCWYFFFNFFSYKSWKHKKYEETSTKMYTPLYLQWYNISFVEPC